MHRVRMSEATVTEDTGRLDGCGAVYEAVSYEVDLIVLAGSGRVRRARIVRLCVG